MKNWLIPDGPIARTNVATVQGRKRTMFWKGFRSRRNTTVGYKRIRRNSKSYGIPFECWCTAVPSEQDVVHHKTLLLVKLRFKLTLYALAQYNQRYVLLQVSESNVTRACYKIICKTAIMHLASAAAFMRFIRILRDTTFDIFMIIVTIFLLYSYR